MGKNFRKIPFVILQKIEDLQGEFTVGTIVDLTEAQFSERKFSDWRLKKEENGELSYQTLYVPHVSKGKYSKKNVEGYRVRYLDRPKILKSYYMGERPIWGDYSNGTFSLIVSRLITPYDEIPPKEVAFIVRLIETKEVNGVIHYIFKVNTNVNFDRNNENIVDELFFHLNLIQENFGSVDVYQSYIADQYLLNSVLLSWDIFPPGERDEDLNRITSGLRNLSRERVSEIAERYNFLRDQNPRTFITGRSGMLRYFGAQFSDNLVVFENTNYGNALYLLFENWRELSQLSRLEIQDRPKDQYIRVKHIGAWQQTVSNIIQAKR
jgi:hypothetical protein